MDGVCLFARTLSLIEAEQPHRIRYRKFYARVRPPRMTPRPFR